jgi:hypothetical protein
MHRYISIIDTHIWQKNTSNKKTKSMNNLRAYHTQQTDLDERIHDKKDNTHTMNTYTQHRDRDIDVFLFIQTKTEKLSAAVYMVTSYISDSEPVKSLLRVTAFSSTGHASRLSVRQEMLHLHELEKDILHIISLTKLSHTLGIVSHMNGEILLTEYTKLLDLLQRQKNQQHQLRLHIESAEDETHYKKKESELKGQTLETESLSQKLHTVPRSEPEAHTAQSAEDVSNNSVNVRSAAPSAHSSGPQTNEQKTIHIAHKISPIAHTTTLRSKPSLHVSSPENKERRNMRQNQVLAALSTTRELGIKDISIRIKGCSEKTIQRELNQLTEQGKIKRVGEKRWSRYIKL